jgi:hypothetical protein
MTVANKPLVLDFIEWVAARPRSYSEAMEAWRTSCPRLTIWEDCVDLGFIVVKRTDGVNSVVELTAQAREFLRSERAVP